MVSEVPPTLIVFVMSNQSVCFSCWFLWCKRQPNAPSVVILCDSLTNTANVGRTCLTRNVGQCPTWWLPCRTYVAPSVPRRIVWLMLTTWLPCSNAAKSWKLFKFAGVPQTGKPISAAGGLKFTILWGHLEDILLLNKFFSDCRCVPFSCEDVAQQSCAMVPRWRFLATFLRPMFSASRMQHVSDLHLKFTLRPHHVWKYGRYPICDGWD